MQKLVKIDLVGNFYIFHCVMKYKIDFYGKNQSKDLSISVVCIDI